MSPRAPYAGSQRRLLVGIDVGTTFSGISFSILDPGIVPVIQGVNRYPAQEKVGGDAKIPSIIYYDKQGSVRAVGAETLLERNAELAEEEGWVKAEWFKLHFRPVSADPLPPLPPNKTVVEVFGDYLRYLYQCARIYILETYASGPELWASLKDHVEFVLTHPNGWEGAQQAQMRKAAIHGGLIRDHPDQTSRIQFVTEGEAGLHYCIGNDYASDIIKSGKGVIIVDAGGGTIDVSAYYMKAPPASFEEIAPAACHFQGSVYVTRRAHKFLENKLYASHFSSPDDIKHITECFDRTTKLGFKDPTQPSYIKFGTTRDKDPSVGIKLGQLKLPGSDVVKLFEPCLAIIIEAIQQQRAAAIVPITAVMLVGGFAASDWLFTSLRSYLEGVGLGFSRPDGHLGKAVADGAVSFQLDHFVFVRVARVTYGAAYHPRFDETDLQHVCRSHTIFTKPSGKKAIPGGYDVILAKGSRASEETEFRQNYYVEKKHLSSQNQVRVDVIAYRGNNPPPKWLDLEPNMFSVLCTVTADISKVTWMKATALDGSEYYHFKYSVILLFGLTEHKALLCWMEDGKEMRSRATIVYDQAVGKA